MLYKDAFFSTVLLVWLASLNVLHAQFTSGAQGTDDPYLREIGNGGYDVQHYDLTIDYDPVANYMKSKADITILATQGLTDFSLDLHGFTNVSAAIDGETVDAQLNLRTNKIKIIPNINIESNQLFHVSIIYSGSPSIIKDDDGSYEGWIRTTNGGFVLNEPKGAMGWFPNNNTPSDKATYEFHITVPTNFTALGNGELISKIDNGDGTLTWNWRMDYPMSSYLSTATVGEFLFPDPSSANVLGGTNGNPITIYKAIDKALDGDQMTVAVKFADCQEKIIEFISDKIYAPYPFDSHGVVICRATNYYSLEVQTKPHFTGTNDDILSTITNQWMLAHEIAHQWFGDSVGPATWREIWFNEGEATWWEWCWDNQVNESTITVEDQFWANYNDPNNDWNWRLPPADLKDASNLFVTFSVYTRPAMMLEAYRQIVDESNFFKFQHALATDYAYSSITTTQFIVLAKQIAQESAGFDAYAINRLDNFFHQWLFDETKPTLTPATFFLALNIRQIAASELEITWPATSAQVVLEQADELARSSWVPVNLVPEINNGTNRVTVELRAGSRFYRLKEN